MVQKGWLTYTVLTAYRVYFCLGRGFVRFCTIPSGSLISDLLCGAEGHRGYNTVSWDFFFFLLLLPFS